MRHHEVTRLEGFSDAVFGFALTLLVVSLDVPNNFAGLMTTLRGFLPFAATFATIIWIWCEHNAYFRRFGLQDNYTIFLNSALLFVVLFYVYPLKFMATYLASAFMGPPSPGSTAMDLGLGEATSLLRVYGLGWVAVFVLFALLYRHGLSRRGRELSALEIWQVRTDIASHLLSIGIGLFSLLITLLASPTFIGLAGFAYALLGPGHLLLHWLADKKKPPEAVESSSAESISGQVP